MTRPLAIRSDHGFSLFEVLVSTALLGIASAGVMPAFLLHFKTITTNELRSEAIAAAQIALDDLRVLDPSTFPTSGSDTPVDIQIGTRSYSVTKSYCTTSALCPSASTRQVHLSVVRNGKEIYALETVFTKLR